MRRMVLTIFVPAAMFSTVLRFLLSIPSDIDNAVRLFSPKMIMLILLPMFVNYFHDYVERVALALQFKICFELRNIIRLGHWRRKNFSKGLRPNFIKEEENFFYKSATAWQKTVEVAELL
jgi:hypothetical protein